jgi:hypothetical protein
MRKKILIYGGVIVIAYLLYRHSQKKSEPVVDVSPPKEEGEEIVLDGDITTEVPDPISTPKKPVLETKPIGKPKPIIRPKPISKPKPISSTKPAIVPLPLKPKPSLVKQLIKENLVTTENKPISEELDLFTPINIPTKPFISTVEEPVPPVTVSSLSLPPVIRIMDDSGIITEERASMGLHQKFITLPETEQQRLLDDYDIDGFVPKALIGAYL